MSFLLPVSADSSTWHIANRTSSLATEIPLTKFTHDSRDKGIWAGVCRLDPSILLQSDQAINLPSLLYLVQLTCSFRYLPAPLAFWQLVSVQPDRFSSDSQAARTRVSDGGFPQADHFLSLLPLVSDVCPSVSTAPSVNSCWWGWMRSPTCTVCSPPLGA